MKIGDREYVLVPKHLFDKVHPTCNKFLLSINSEHVADLDGCHDAAQGVAEAQHLIQRLGLGSGDQRRVMITVEEVPEFHGEVNEEAIAILAPAITRLKKG